MLAAGHPSRSAGTADGRDEDPERSAKSQRRPLTPIALLCNTEPISFLGGPFDDQIARASSSRHPTRQEHQTRKFS